MVLQIELGDITADVVLKEIKNVHLSVYPPKGRVRISAPKRMSIDTIRVFAISKLAWIKQQQAKLREQERETPRDTWTGRAITYGGSAICSQSPRAMRHPPSS
jgi:predicted metal-dependent hydrolase